ncbi:MAG: metal ABC transporter ATP-binding protein [Bradymonadaceae bacterium]|nr:metal ABC transporter ATP-binding protein [Lujinxingiaceae bacterium]
MSEAVLCVTDLTVYYGDELALDSVGFSLTGGKLIGVVGPNGAGKSTMIKAIVGSILPNRGKVEVFGSTAKRALRRITYVPQRGSVDWDFPVTVRDVVAQGRYAHLGLFRRFTTVDRDLVERSLELVGLVQLAERQIGELSGGQQQRVFLARALAQQGDIYLMDEPFAGVDAATESAIVEVLRSLRDEGKTVLVVHHDLSTLREYFEELVLINRKLIAHGPTDKVFTPDLLQRTYGGKLAVFSNKDTTLVSA